jgi:serine/threonine protein kinase
MARILTQKKREESDYANYTSFYTGLGATTPYKSHESGISQRPNSAGAVRRVHSGYSNNNRVTTGVLGPGTYDPRYGTGSTSRPQQHQAPVSIQHSGEVHKKRTIWTPAGIQTEYYTEKTSTVNTTSNIPVISHTEQHTRPKSAGTSRTRTVPVATAPAVTALPPAQHQINDQNGTIQNTPLLQPKTTNIEQSQHITTTSDTTTSAIVTDTGKIQNWNAPYKLHYGGGGGGGQQQQYHENIPPSEVSQANSGFSNDGRATLSMGGSGGGSGNSGNGQIVRVNSAPTTRPSSASSRIRTAVRNAQNNGIGLDDDDDIANDDEDNDDLDAHLREMTMGGLLGAGRRGDRPLTAFYEGVEDSGIDGGPRSRSHPEVSTTTPSQSVDLLGNGDSALLDIRNNSSFISEQDRTTVGLSTIPNQFCSVREALELLKIIIATKPGALSSSSMVMDMYMVGKVVGVGSYGKVRAAWHRLTGTKVAIKTYDKAKFKDPEHWKRVQSEIKIMEQISHPRIARLFDSVETPKRMHLIMECLDGGNLCSYVKSKKRLSEEESKRIFFQLVQSIEYLHSYSVIHRDVKLENVLFNDIKDVKLIDFGFSTVCQKGKRLRVFCGTPSYMAPEIVRRSEYEGKPVDMWSLGILLYAILCGYFPFRAKNYPDLYRRIARGVFEIPEELSSNAKDLIKQLLTMDPTQRLTAPGCLKHPWLQSAYSNASDIAKMRSETPILISEKPADDLDESVLRELEEFGLNKDELSKQILSKTHSAITTLYYLLLDATITARKTGTAVRGKYANNAMNAMHNLQSQLGVSSDPSNGVGTNGSSNSGVNWKKYGQQATYAPSPALIARSDSPGANLLQGVLNSRPKSASGGRSNTTSSSGTNVNNIGVNVTNTTANSSQRPHSAYAGRR